MNNIIKTLIPAACLGYCLTGQAQWNFDEANKAKTDSTFGFLQRPGDADRDQQTLRINEICASNQSLLADENGNYADWIELHNYGDEEINLSGRWLSDDPADPYKHQIAGNILVSPGGFVLLFADGNPDSGPAHLDFTLNMEGEDVLLHTEDFALIDALSFGYVPADVSYGFDSFSGAHLLYSLPTPGAANGEVGYESVLTAPVFSNTSLFYEAPFSLALSQPDAEVIRYTIDGSDPDAASLVYTQPIEVNADMCVRAIAEATGALSSLTASRCYVAQIVHELGVISVVCPEPDLFGASGIYSNPFSGVEKEAHVGFYSPEGESLHGLNMGMRIHAPDGRLQKSLRFYARSEYGASSVDHVLFPDSEIDQYKRFILRNAGNDGTEAGLSRTGLRDPLISWLYGSIDEDYGRSLYEPVHLYLNGTYWGIYNMRERQDEHFIKSHYGYEEGEIDFLERTAGAPDTRNEIAGTWEDYDLMHQTAIDLDLSQPENYAIMQDWMDMENFVDYQLTEILICNQDWLSNNMKFWKPHDNSRKWEWIIWDTDWGFGTYYPSYPHGSPDWNALNFALSNWGGWTTDIETYLLQNLTDNPEFLNYFCTRAADLRNSYFLPERITDQLSDYRTRIENDMDMQFERWGSSETTWQSKLAYMESFIEQRPEFFLQHFSDYFDLGTIYPVTLTAQPETGGYIEVNTIRTDSLPWTGFYFQNVPVRLKAIAHPGHLFSGWSDAYPLPERWIDLASDTAFTALFQPGELPTQVIINEINYNSWSQLNAGEWIEVRNNGPAETNLNGWSFHDESGQTYQVNLDLVLQVDSFAVLCADTMLFKTNYPEIDKIAGQFSFSLSNDGEALTLTAPNGIVSSIVQYGVSSPWPSTPNGSGPTLELMNPEADPGLPSSWFARATPGGTPGEENTIDIGIEEKTTSLKAVVFPNPSLTGTAGTRLLVSNKEHGSLTLTVFDSNGKQLNSGRPTNFEAGLKFASFNDLAGIPGLRIPGIYLVRIESGKKALSIKLVVEGD